MYLDGTLPITRLTQNARRERSLMKRVTALAPPLFVILFAVLFRSPQFVNPDVDFDEPFYLLVGDRLLHGATVYVDIWDRKPIGLFLIFAATRLLGGAGFIQYLFVAALFAGATGAIIWSIAKRYTGRWAATLPALIYIVWQEPYNGGGGQSAIFYNLFTACAMLLTLQAKDLGSPHKSLCLGLGAMLLTGLGMQVKYTLVAEGIFLGLAFLVLIRRQGYSLPKTGLAALLLAVVAVVPTGAACLYYLAIGHWQEFYYANFISIFERGRLVHEYVIQNLNYISIIGLPLTVLAILGLRALRTGSGPNDQSDYPFLLGWVIAAVLGFVMIGNFYYYYFMPVLLPLSVVLAPHFHRQFWRVLVAFLLLWWPIAVSGFPKTIEANRRAASVTQLTSIIRPMLGQGGLYIFDGPSALYMTTGSPPPSRFAYPDHLSNDVERPALGTDATKELQRILNNRPDVIVVASKPVVPLLNRENALTLRDTLERNYVQVAGVKHGWRTIIVFGRRSARQAPIPAAHWVYPTELTHAQLALSVD
jgi:hypothetical protein